MIRKKIQNHLAAVISGIILRNILLLAFLSLILTIFSLKPTWASEIIFVFGCTDTQLMPPGGGGQAAVCTGVAACYNSEGEIGI